MKKTFVGFVSAFVLLGAFYAPAAQAETMDRNAMLEMIQTLLKQVEELQQRLSEVRGEIRDVIAQGLEEGMTHEDIREIQEILASDPSVYPEGLVTGYFGPLTKQALRRFQTKFELEVTGEIDEETRAALETLLQERFGDDVPPGLLNAPGIRKKFERRLELGCDNSGPGSAPFCAKIKEKYKFDDDDDESDDDDDDVSDDDSDNDSANDDDDSDDDSDDDDDESDDDDDDSDDDDDDDDTV